MIFKNGVYDYLFQIHNWDMKIQGTILSSFFFGYALLLIPAELVLKRIGGKVVTTIILLANGAMCLAMPIIVNRVSNQHTTWQ
jgi:fucose permease